MKKNIVIKLIFLIAAIAVVALLCIAMSGSNRGKVKNELLKNLSFPEKIYGLKHYNSKEDGEAIFFRIDAPLKDDSLIIQFEQTAEKLGWKECSYQNLENGWTSFIDDREGKGIHTLKFRRSYEKDGGLFKIEVIQPSLNKSEIAQTFFVLVKKLDGEQCI